VKVNHKSLVKPLVLQRAPWMAAQHRKRVLRLIRMLPEVTVMMLLAMRTEIILMLPKVKETRCDEGYHV
jgi:hypothetical protein